MPTNKLAIYIGRGKVILLGDGMIDDADPRNTSFIQKHNDKVEVDKPVKDLPTENRPADKKETTENSSTGLSKFALELEKLEKTNKKLDVETRLAELKEEKIRGEVIPIALVSTIFKTHTQQIVTAQKDFIENLLINISKEHRLTGDQLAKLRGKMVDGLNVAVDKAINASKRNLKSLVDEFSIKKEVGEHE